MGGKDNNDLTFKIEVARKFFPSPIPWRKSIGGDAYIVKKKTFKTLKKVYMGAGSAVVIGMQVLLNSSINVLNKIEGASYIVEKFEGNIVPNGLKANKLEDNSIELQYVDANNEVQNVSGDSVGYLIEEFTEVTLANGYSVDWLAVYLNEKCGRDVSELLCIDENEFDKAKLEAYKFKKYEEQKAGYDVRFSDYEGRRAEYEDQRNEYISRGAKK